MTLKKWIDLPPITSRCARSSMHFSFHGLIVFFMVLMSSVNTLLMTMFERTEKSAPCLPWERPLLDRGALHGGAVIIGVLGAVAGVVVGIYWAWSSTCPVYICRRAGYTVNIPFLVKHVPAS